jgi:hypothetical protein
LKGISHQLRHIKGSSIVRRSGRVIIAQHLSAGG